MNKLSDYFSYKKLKKYQGLLGKLPCRAGSTRVGVEIELEQVSMKNLIPSSFTEEQDGSLKLEGKEFITVPIKFHYLEKELERLFSSFRTPPLLSSRCSIHVHLNVRDMTMEELGKFIMLYCIYEKALFNYSGNRVDNIFCVPLWYYPKLVSTALYYCSINTPEHLHWYKYYALNISPIFGGEGKHKLGTVEFRHMAPTLDIKKIINWINLIVSLKISAKKIKTDVLTSQLKTMNTDSSYHQLTNFVFTEWAPLILQQKTFKEDIEASITSLKTSMAASRHLPEETCEKIIQINPKMKGNNLCAV